MEFVASSRWLVRGHSWASTSFRAVAAPRERKRQRCSTLTGSTWSLAQFSPRHKCRCSDPSRPARLAPEEALTAARERVQKLERALEVLGEDSGPEFQVLQNSLKKAKAAAQSVPVGVQLEQTLKFVERSEKRLRVLDEERAKEARLLEEAQQRVARLRSELAAGPQHPPPTVPPDYVQELVQLRACVEGLQREREDLRVQLSMRGERRSRGRSRSLPNPSPDLVTGEQRGSVVNERSHRLSSVMETLIDNADSSARSNHRFNPM